MNIARPSAADRVALESIAAIAPDWRSLDWVVESGVGRGRVNRLVTLGLVERRLDGRGWFVRVNRPRDA